MLEPGDTIRSPRGTVVEHVIEPRVRFVEVSFPTWPAWLADGRVGARVAALRGLRAIT
jgi:hypothetical protein